MNLILGYEMGAALLAKHGDIEACWAKAQAAAAAQSQGPVLHQNVDRIEKGVFPQQLGRLRGHLLSATDEVVVVVLECGPHVLTLVTGETLHGMWSVSQQKWYPLKEEEMCGPPLIEQVTQLCKDAGNVWVAYFLMTNPVAAPVAAATTTKKKTVVRKRVLAEPVVEVVAKKAAAAALPNEEEGSEINKLE
jgi:hypothetical protein